VKEKDLQKGIIDIAHRFGWLVAHFTSMTDSRGFNRTPVMADGKGFPDLCLVRERIVFAEVKAGRNQLSAEQKAWRDAIIKAGGEWYEWREGDYDHGVVEAVLRPASR